MLPTPVSLTPAAPAIVHLAPTASVALARKGAAITAQCDSGWPVAGLPASGTFAVAGADALETAGAGGGAAVCAAVVLALLAFAAGFVVPLAAAALLAFLGAADTFGLTTLPAALLGAVAAAGA